MFILFFS